VKDLQQFKQCMKSDEFAVYTSECCLWRERLAYKDAEDVNNFIDTDRGVKIMVGYDNIVFGEAVPGYGRDGVVRSEIERWHKENPDVPFADVEGP
jgi:hypothetical protein